MCALGIKDHDKLHWKGYVSVSNTNTHLDHSVVGSRYRQISVSKYAEKHTFQNTTKKIRSGKWIYVHDIAFVKKNKNGLLVTMTTADMTARAVMMIQVNAFYKIESGFPKFGCSVKVSWTPWRPGSGCSNIIPFLKDYARRMGNFVR